MDTDQPAQGLVRVLRTTSAALGIALVMSALGACSVDDPQSVLSDPQSNRFEDAQPAQASTPVASPPQAPAQGNLIGKPDLPGRQFLGVADGALDDGAKARVSPASFNTNIARSQQWILWEYRDDMYHIINVSSGKCLEANGTDGSVDQWACSNESNHLWTLAQSETDDMLISLTVNEPYAGLSSGTYYLATSTSDKTGYEVVLTKDKDARTAWTAS